MEVLRTVAMLKLKDWAIGAGFVRNLVWDNLHEYTEATPKTDIDVIYFDPDNLSEETETAYQQRLAQLMSGEEWSVTNQARMGRLNNQNRDYVSTEDGLAHWTETATAIAVRLTEDEKLELMAPHGLDDLLSLTVRMTPEFGDGPDTYIERIAKKQWATKWPRLKVILATKDLS